MLQIFRGKICNVADLPEKGLQCCRSSVGKVCNVADLPGGVFKGERLQNNTVTTYLISLNVTLNHN